MNAQLGPFPPKPGEPLIIALTWDKEWKAAICTTMEVSGFGGTIREALESCARSIESTLLAFEKIQNTP